MESTSTPPGACNVAIPTTRRNASRTDTSTIRTAVRSAAVQEKTVVPRGSIMIPWVVPNVIKQFIAVRVYMGLTMILTGAKFAVHRIHRWIVHVTDNTRMPMVVPNVVRVQAALIVKRTGITWILINVKSAVLRGMTTEVIVLVLALVPAYMGITVIQRVVVNVVRILATVRLEGMSITLKL